MAGGQPTLVAPIPRRAQLADPAGGPILARSVRKGGIPCGSPSWRVRPQISKRGTRPPNIILPHLRVVHRELAAVPAGLQVEVAPASRDRATVPWHWPCGTGHACAMLSPAQS